MSRPHWKNVRKYTLQSDYIAFKTSIKLHPLQSADLFCTCCVLHFYYCRKILSFRLTSAANIRSIKAQPLLPVALCSFPIWHDNMKAFSPSLKKGELHVLRNYKFFLVINILLSLLLFRLSFFKFPSSYISQKYNYVTDNSSWYAVFPEHWGGVAWRRPSIRLGQRTWFSFRNVLTINYTEL